MKPSVFIGSSKEQIDVAKAIEVNLSSCAEVTRWDNTFQAGTPFLTDLLKSKDNYDFAVFVITPDDITISREVESSVTRDNIIFEMGLFIGNIGSERVYCVCDEHKKTKIPSDYHGVTYLTYDGNRSDGNLRNALSSTCNKIEEVVTEIGVRVEKISPSKSLINYHTGNQDRSIVIGISGGSCSGKTWLSHLFKNICPKSVCLFELDGYYKDIAYVNTRQHTHDNPESIDLSYALSHLKELKEGKSIEVPKYNFKLQKREGSQICEPASIIIVEGVFAFTDSDFLKEFDFKVWVEADDTIRYTRRLNRDLKERGRDKSEVAERYAQSVKPGYEKFIYPNRRNTDITIHNNTQCHTIPEGLYSLLAYCNVDINIFKKPI